MTSVILIGLDTLYIKIVIIQIFHIKYNIFNIIQLPDHAELIIYCNKKLLNR